MSNKRLWYGVYQLGVAPVGVAPITSTYAVHGLQSMGVSSRFNLSDVFEIGQLEIYEQFEGVPEVEVTLEKALDGYKLLYHLATPGSTSNSLAGRSAARCNVAASFFSDVQDSASGTALTTMLCSGMFTQSLAYNFTVDGFHTEQVTLVGNNKEWGSITFAGVFNNTDSPSYSGGVSKRWNVVWEPRGTGVGMTSYSRLPTIIENMSSSGVNTKDSEGQRLAHVQRINVSCNLGREEMLELGRRAPYHRYVSFPVEVRSDIEIIAILGDRVNMKEEGYYSDGTNVRNETIRVKSEEGIFIDLGTRNKLSQVTMGGANAGTQGGNMTETYSFRNNNFLTVSHPADPEAFGGY